MHKLLLTILLLLAPVLPAPAQGLAYSNFRSLRLEDTIPGASVHALLQDRHGRLWAGTGAGLALHTGVAWKAVPIGAEGPGMPVRSLLEGRDGSLWVGTERNGLWRLREDHWTCYAPGTGVPFPSSRIQALLETVGPAGQAILWVGTEKGLARFEGGAWRFYGERDGLPDLMIWKLRSVQEPDGQTHLWAATARGSIRLLGDRWEPVGPGQSEEGGVSMASRAPHTNDVVSLERADGQHEVWVSVWNAGVARWDRHGWTLFGPREGFPSRNPTGLAVGRDAAGRTLLWASTYDAGVAWFDGTWHSLGAKEGFPSLNVFTVLPLAGGKPSAVAGTRNAGVQSLDLGGWSALGPRQGLPDDLVTCFAEERREGHAPVQWIGTASGLARLEEGTGKVQVLEGLPSTYIQTILPRAGQGLWVGTLRGLTVFDGHAWRLLGKGDGFPEGAATSLLETPDGTLWVGHTRGLARLEKGAWHFDMAKDAFPATATIALGKTLDADGATSVWVATRDAGVRRLKGGVWQRYAAPLGPGQEGLSCMLPMRDARGRTWVWLGTRTGRLGCLPVDQPGRTAMVFEPRLLPSLGDSPLRTLVLDHQGRLYVLSLTGVTRLTLDPQDPTRAPLRVDSYTTGDGLPNETCYGGFLDGRGRVWAGTPSGAACFDPERETFAPPLPAPTFLRVEEVDSQTALAPGASLGHGQSHLHFEFALPVHPRFEDTRFRTQLLGFEKPGPWRKEAFRDLSGLGPGRYTLRLWARGFNGTESGPVDFGFRVRPPLWLTTWAVGLYGLLLVGAAFLALHLRTRFLTRRARDLEAAVTAALAEVKTLRGFLPVCAWCKKIRDDEGSWDQMENYITLHSEAQFSHGVCPDCRRRLEEELQGGAASGPS